MLEKKNAPDIVTCIKLKTLHYAVDRAYILESIQDFDFMLSIQTKENVWPRIKMNFEIKKRLHHYPFKVKNILKGSLDLIP